MSICSRVRIGGAIEVSPARGPSGLPRVPDGLNALPVAVVHDEVIVEASADDAPETAKRLAVAMGTGMAEVFAGAFTMGLVGGPCEGCVGGEVMGHGLA